MLRATLTAAMAALISCAPTSTSVADDKENPLDGAYTIVSGEKYGSAIPDAEIEGTMVRIADNGIIVTDKSKKDVYASSYKLEGEDGKGPRKITLTSKLAPKEGEVARGLIEKKDETVKLIYALPGGDEPTEFKTKEKQIMFVLKYQKK